MKITPIVTTIVLFLFLSIGIITNNSTNASDDKDKPASGAGTENAVIIKVSAIDDAGHLKINVTPCETVVKKDTIVIWVNFIDGPEINIAFDDAKAVSAATKDLQSFYIDDEGIFSAKYMPFIATSSIRFIKDGEFGYTISSSDEKEVVSGKVIVK